MRMNAALSRRQAVKLGAAATIAAGLAGCSSAGDSTGSDYPQDKRIRKVALVISGPAQDGGWAQSHYDAIRAACNELGGWQFLEPQENTTAAASADLAQSYADQGVDLIVAAGTQFASAWGDVVAKVAKQRPDCKFLFTNADPKRDLSGYTTLDSVEVVEVDYGQIGSLAGVVAGLMTQTNSIGFVGGDSLSSTEAKYEAYVAAAQKVNPQVEGHADFSAGFAEASEGRRVAKSLISAHNVDVMWSDASAADNGVRQALEDAGADAHFDIAQPRDLMGTATVIASTVISWPVRDAMERVVKEVYGNGASIAANMVNGGIALGELSDKIPADVQKKIADYADQIVAGTF